MVINRIAVISKTKQGLLRFQSSAYNGQCLLRKNPSYKVNASYLNWD